MNEERIHGNPSWKDPRGQVMKTLGQLQSGMDPIYFPPSPGVFSYGLAKHATPLVLSRPKGRLANQCSFSLQNLPPAPSAAPIVICSTGTKLTMESYKERPPAWNARPSSSIRSSRRTCGRCCQLPDPRHASAAALLDASSRRRSPPATSTPTTSARWRRCTTSEVNALIEQAWGKVKTERDPERVKVVEQMKKLVTSQPPGDPRRRAGRCSRSLRPVPHDLRPGRQRRPRPHRRRPGEPRRRS